MNLQAVLLLSLHTFNNDMIVKKIQTTYFELENKIVSQTCIFSYQVFLQRTEISHNRRKCSGQDHCNIIMTIVERLICWYYDSEEKLLRKWFECLWETVFSLLTTWGQDRPVKVCTEPVWSQKQAQSHSKAHDIISYRGFCVVLFCIIICQRVPSGDGWGSWRV